MSAERETARELDPNVLQRKASNPISSIWVSASAGTGKTKVLTDRILRLLLPQDNGAPGCPPHKILGLTFTKAAASEMAIRVNETLSEWSIASNEDLQEKLKSLLGRQPEKQDIAAARKLFAEVIDTPGRLKIMTIHSFCQSVLSRFPLEAGLTPGFEVAEERMTAAFLAQAKSLVFREIINQKDSPLNAALINLSQSIDEEKLDQLIASIMSERGQLTKILDKTFGADGLYTTLCQTLDIHPNQTRQTILEAACNDECFDRDGLKSCADTMAGASKTDIKNAAPIHHFLSLTQRERVDYFDTYKTAFLTAENEIRKKLLTKAVTNKSPHLLDIMQKEAERIIDILETIRASEIAKLTHDIFVLSTEILKKYAAIKKQNNMLDYEDLIFKTSDLLKTRSQWVQFKLDQGIDHILIDEAQDTNPEQWTIIEALTEEFFATHSKTEDNRTIFTVGDEKQSIYSFQRASPEEFQRMRAHFSEKINAAQKLWSKVDLNISFRSIKSVLSAVDTIFADPQNRKGLSLDEINHDAHRRGQAGIVELWPLFENDATEEIRTWDPPVSIMDQKSGSTKCAETIADQIQNWIKSETKLESHNRPIQPGDIMILVRTRNAFVTQLMRALKTRNIAVGGLDRIILNEQLAVQDMLATCEFALLPSNDLNLACLLKSPLIGLNEDELFNLAYNRNGSLWDAVQNNAPENITIYLKTLIKRALSSTPYAFLSELLQTPCPADDISGIRAFKKRLGIDAIDSLDELLNAAMSFEHDHTPSLQNFLHWQNQSESDLKRENDDQSNHVRIMTIHGSKGLQAPIVFLPDTTSTPGLNATQAGSRLLWPSQTGEELPLWAPIKDLESKRYKSAKETLLERMDEEYRRLLYVALTRAEDHLYITGYKGKKNIGEKCWYNLCKTALKSHPDIVETDGQLRLSNPQTKDADRKPKPVELESADTNIPKWMLEPAPKEPDPPIQLLPSRPSEIEPASISPLQADSNYRFRRGNVTHKLLQFLPDINDDKKDQSMHDFLTKHASDLPDSVRQSIAEETKKIFNHPQFAPIFGQNSRAEVPISGRLPDGRIISGQIDRLIITDHEILIVDFKTNRPPPTDSKDVPQIYYNQLKAYADTLKEIYPNHTIKTALLWTDGPNLMPLDMSGI